MPKLYHAVGKDASPPPAVVGNAARNPDFQLRYLGDEAAAKYVKARCGEAAHAAYQCFVAPAYRADLFRYCALHADGGVYLDTDIMLAVSIPEAVDMCDGATLGHDIPQLPLPPHRLGDAVVPGMQMKILGGEPGHPLFKCMLDGIIGHVRTRFSSRYPLQARGPLTYTLSIHRRMRLPVPPPLSILTFRPPPTRAFLLRRLAAAGVTTVPLPPLVSTPVGHWALAARGLLPPDAAWRFDSRESTPPRRSAHVSATPGRAG